MDADVGDTHHLGSGQHCMFIVITGIGARPGAVQVQPGPRCCAGSEVAMNWVIGMAQSEMEMNSSPFLFSIVLSTSLKMSGVVLFLQRSSLVSIDWLSSLFT